MTTPSTRPLALVTGASSGIGAVYAEQLAQKGYDLILTARRQERLEGIKADLETRFGAHTEVVTADLGTTDGVNAVLEHVRTKPLELLVSNAGFAHYAPVVQTPESELEDMILLNIMALVKLTRGALPGMLERKRGAIIQVASGLAFLPGATRATYSGTKAFVVNFTRALAEEVKDSGVRVQVLVPALIRTEFHERSGTDLSRFPADMVMDPRDLVMASLKGLERDEVVCIPALKDAGELEALYKAQFEMASGVVRNGHVAERYR
jgi:short-subunit dehydrogenase